MHVGPPRPGAAHTSPGVGDSTNVSNSRWFIVQSVKENSNRQFKSVADSQIFNINESYKMFLISQFDQFYNENQVSIYLMRQINYPL